MHAWFRASCILVGIIFCQVACLAGGGPKNVLLVVNENSPVSQSVGAYYQQKRGVPARNVCRIRCSTSEQVSKAECETNIVAPIRAFINSSGIHDRIDYIVLTKGVPLKASYNDAAWWGPVSVSSVLTCLGETSIAAPCTNPYGPTVSPQPVAKSFTHQTSFGGKSYYMVTRLDAYTEVQIRRMIDDSLSAYARSGLFLLDGRYEVPNGSSQYYANDRLRQANSSMYSLGYSTYYDSLTFDSMVTEFAGGQQGVMGYFSWGSNESSYDLPTYTSNLFVPGSIAESYVSSSGRTFTEPPTYGQSLIADLIPQGVSGCTGYVSEPGASLQTYPTTLFDRYLQGYNMGESFFAATPRLYWKAATIGDPLMAPYATPPSITISVPSAQPVHGTVTISATASDESGIKKVEFYVDDLLKTTCSSPPYRLVWDTGSCTTGRHVVEAIAYENSPVSTQRIASAAVDVDNTPHDVATVSQLRAVPLGTLVRLQAKEVIAGWGAFTDCAYICESDRSAGVRVIGAFPVATGRLATVVGDVAMLGDERVIQATTVTDAGVGASVRPFSLANRYVGNRGDNSAPEYSGLKIGLPNTSRLVKTWGRVKSIGVGEFAISDGSMELKDAPIQEIKVSMKDMRSPPPMPSQDSFALVTGVCCYTLEGGLMRPTIRPRSAEDVIEYPL